MKQIKIHKIQDNENFDKFFETTIKLGQFHNTKTLNLNAGEIHLSEVAFKFENTNKINGFIVSDIIPLGTKNGESLQQLFNSNDDLLANGINLFDDLFIPIGYLIDGIKHIYNFNIVYNPKPAKPKL